MSSRKRRVKVSMEPEMRYRYDEETNSVYQTFVVNLEDDDRMVRWVSVAMLVALLLAVVLFGVVLPSVMSDGVSVMKGVGR